MKKLVFMFVAVAAISFASCGNTQKPNENVDTTAVETVDSLNDSIEADSVPAEAPAEAADSVQ